MLMTILVLVAQATTYENLEALKKMSLDNHRINIRAVADDVSTSCDSCQAIFMDVFGMKRAAAQIVPKLLNFEEK